MPSMLISAALGVLSIHESRPFIIPQFNSLGAIHILASLLLSQHILVSEYSQPSVQTSASASLSVSASALAPDCALYPKICNPKMHKGRGAKAMLGGHAERPIMPEESTLATNSRVKGRGFHVQIRCSAK